ncbi:homeodomain-interacting protein kinase 2-like [Lates calcarifer]|uniref:Homeodomain-interacting protein kinase 2 n=1 Tax=Lates calcarifer TaxID=8187 RepID=A0AAJ8DVK7_LATCA|nr:homeodomain-interacting protein kinase 2 [Lates calcarifer]XP_050932715.1 homeodomain-interacting protein kinase 2-like [Lates calcarifer]
MRRIIDILDQPADHLLCDGMFTKKFFKVVQQGGHYKWQLKTPGEYQQETGTVVTQYENSVRSLDKLLTLYPVTQGSTEMEDRRAFVDLLKCLLQVDPGQRISPLQALQHPFITKAHLEEEMDTS